MSDRSDRAGGDGLREILATIKIGDNAILRDVIRRGLASLGWVHPSGGAEDMIDAIYNLGTAAPPQPAPDALREAMCRAFADAVVTIEGVAHALKRNPLIDPEQTRHDLLLNISLYRETAEANGIDIQKIKPDDEPYNFLVERDGHAALNRRLAERLSTPLPSGEQGAS